MLSEGVLTPFKKQAFSHYYMYIVLSNTLDIKITNIKIFFLPLFRYFF